MQQNYTNDFISKYTGEIETSELANMHSIIFLIRYKLTRFPYYRDVYIIDIITLFAKFEGDLTNQSILYVTICVISYLSVYFGWCNNFLNYENANSYNVRLSDFPRSQIKSKL